MAAPRGFGPDPCGPGPRQSIRLTISPERSITSRRFEPHPDAVGHVRRLMSPRWHCLAVRSYHSNRGVRRVIGRPTAALAKAPFSRNTLRGSGAAGTANRSTLNRFPPALAHPTEAPQPLGRRWKVGTPVPIYHSLLATLTVAPRQWDVPTLSNMLQTLQRLAAPFEAPGRRGRHRESLM